MISHFIYPDLAPPTMLDFRAPGHSPLALAKAVGAHDVLLIKLSGYRNHVNVSENDQNTLVVDSFEIAKQHLLYLVNSRQALPRIIVYEGRIRFAQLKQLYAFLQLHESLRFIPFVYNHCNDGVFDNSELYQMVRSKLFDNVISGIEDLGALLKSAEVLSNVKRSRVESNSNYTSIETSGPTSKTVDLFLKRLVDIVISASLIILFAPLMLLIGILIRLESKGPIFYIAKRAGKCFQVFDFYKFRTMIVDADAKLNEYQDLNKYFNEEQVTKSPRFFKLKNDPRVTRMGAFLRKTSLDELPQLFNVLKGDMSLVGNRPLPLYEAATLTCDEWAERFIAPAGITGLWQISRRGKDSMSVEERVGLDIEYSRKFSFLYDLKIMALTPKAMFQD